jgi:MATE family, multidrug efflux pump
LGRGVRLSFRGLSVRRVLRRSPYDREILRLALPALGALAAEPLYVLVDTAIVGHLGTPELAALALAGTILTGSFTLFNFLTYGTTAQVARYHGAGQPLVAGRLAAQALWLSAGIGLGLLGLALTFAVPAVQALGGAHHTGSLAVLYLRIGAIGLPFALIALAGQGYLRGTSSMRRPLVIVVVANLANVVLEVLFVYVFHWGLAGSAWGTVIAQAGMGTAFAIELLRAPADDRRPSVALMRPLARVGSDIFVRTASLYAALIVASAVLARVGPASLAAHQVAFQLWIFLALVLDAVAIAAQVIVGRSLGAGLAEEAYDSALRMIGWSFLLGAVVGAVMLALINVLPHVFTGDPEVLDRLRAIWPIFALMQPLNGIVFALDGILIGAGDTRFLKWSTVFAGVAVYIPIALLALNLGWGIVGVWCGLVGLILARLTTCGVRFVSRRWAVVGVPESA